MLDLLDPRNSPHVTVRVFTYSDFSGFAGFAERQTWPLFEITVPGEAGARVSHVTIEREYKRELASIFGKLTYPLVISQFAIENSHL